MAACKTRNAAMEPKDVAKEIKEQHEQSGEIFPNELGFNRFGSLYAQDFSLDSIRPKVSMGMTDRDWECDEGLNASARNKPHPSVMFMNWKVPTRLYNQAVPPQLSSSQNSNPDYHVKVSKLAEKIPPAYLTRKTHDRTTTTHFTPKQGMLRQMREQELEQEILREKYTRERNKKGQQAPAASRFPAMPVLSAKLNVKQTIERPRNAGVMPVPNNALTMSGKIRKEITQGDRNYINNAYSKPSQTETVRVVNTWLETASPRDRELAVQFFGSLAGKKLLGGDQAAGGSRPQNSDACKVCDATRLKEVLKALNTGKPIESDRRDLRPGESNRQRLRLLSPFTRRHKEEMQTWHHLPQFRHRGPVSNTIALFTRPHKPAQRHFTIHPEWE